MNFNKPESIEKLQIYQGLMDLLSRKSRGLNSLTRVIDLREEECEAIQKKNSAPES